MDNRGTLWDRLDYTLLFIIFLLLCTSCFVLYTAQADNLINGGSFLKGQVVMYFLSVPVFLLAMFIDLDVVSRVSFYIYLFCVLFMLGILIAPDSIAPTLNGAKGWYRFGSMSLQPSEFMKIGLILVLSSKLSVLHEEKTLTTMKEEFLFIGQLVLYMIPLAFFAKEFPDLGSLLVDSAIFITILFVSKIRIRTILILIAPFALLLAALIVIYFVDPNMFFNSIISRLPLYQAQRFYGWLDPYRYTNSDGYQLQSSLNAIGSGELSGASLSNFSVPYAYSDFIFSIVGGKWGLLGASILILAYFILVYRIVKIGTESHSPFGTLVCAGTIGMLGYQIFQNIGMTIGVLPITGLSLPFISYGGSSLLVVMFAMGLVFNVKINTYKFMFQ